MKIQLHPLSLLTGAALALTIGAQAVRRTAVIAPPVQTATLDCPKEVPWPPHPEDRFQFSAKDLPDSYQPSLGARWVFDLEPGEDRLIYAVPADRWLLLNYGSVESSGVSDVYVELSDGSTDRLPFDGATDVLGGLVPPSATIRVTSVPGISATVPITIDFQGYFARLTGEPAPKELPWPPHPADRFQFSAKDVLGSNQNSIAGQWELSLSPGEDREIYEVPSNRWLVLNYAEIGDFSGTLLTYVEFPDGTTDRLPWSGETTELGAIIRPGTRIRIASTDGTPARWDFRGYFAELE